MFGEWYFRAAAALMMGDEINKFSRSPRFERSEFPILSPESRQIYLTFPADSTFREEDVSTYFRFTTFQRNMIFCIYYVII